MRLERGKPGPRAGLVLDPGIVVWIVLDLFSEQRLGGCSRVGIFKPAVSGHGKSFWLWILRHVSCVQPNIAATEII